MPARFDQANSPLIHTLHRSAAQKPLAQCFGLAFSNAAFWSGDASF
jgi:hypothetical protein